MNHPFEQNREKNNSSISTLISLFEKKGYQCEKITGDKETIYVLKSELSWKEKSPQPKVAIN